MSLVYVLHGLFGSCRNWRSITKDLEATLQQRVLALDLPNHGTNLGHPVMNYEETIKVLNFAPNCDIIGHSLGGQIAMMAALRKIIAIRKLVIVDIAPRAYKLQSMTRYFAFMKWVNESSLPDRHAILEAFRKVEPNESIVQFLMMNCQFNGSWHFPMPLKTVQRTLSGFAQEWRQCVAKSMVETMFIRGSNSDYIRDLEECKRLFPNSRLVSLPAGHWVHHEQPKQFVSEVVSFLRSP